MFKLISFVWYAYKLVWW